MSNGTATAPKTRVARTAADKRAAAMAAAAADQATSTDAYMETAEFKARSAMMEQAAAAAAEEATIAERVAAAVAAATAAAAAPVGAPGTMQEAVAAAAAATKALPGTTRVETVETGDATTSVYNQTQARLRTEIQAHGAEILAWFADRGLIVNDAVGALTCKAVNKATRDKFRKAALTGSQSTAIDVYDAVAEPVPNVELWLKIYWLTELCPAALNIHSVDTARAAVVMMSRIDPPSHWTDAEEWVVKDAYADVIDDIIGKVVDGRLNFDDTKALVDSVSGLVAKDKAKKKTDKFVAARQAADRFAKSVLEGKIDAETYFDELDSILGRYGWTKDTD